MDNEFGNNVNNTERIRQVTDITQIPKASSEVDSYNKDAAGGINTAAYYNRDTADSVNAYGSGTQVQLNADLYKGSAAQTGSTQQYGNTGYLFQTASDTGSQATAGYGTKSLYQSAAAAGSYQSGSESRQAGSQYQGLSANTAAAGSYQSGGAGRQTGNPYSGTAFGAAANTAGYTGSSYSRTPSQAVSGGGRKEPPKSGKSKGTGKKVAIAIVAGVVCVALGVGGAFLGNAIINGNNTQTQSAQSSGTSVIQEGTHAASSVEVSKVDTSGQMTPAEVYEKNVNSTVGITTEVTYNYFGYETLAAASGSGFIITSDGYILTNYHVVENASSITVTLYDGTQYEAELIGYFDDEDVAVLKVDAENLNPVVLGDSDECRVGDEVVAIGNPLGELTFSLTSGCISALNRAVTMEGQRMTLIQTDCAINSGNSGGALFNMYGEVIGITNGKYSGQSSSSASIENIGFAIPINRVKDAAESIIEKGYVSQPYMGVVVGDLSDEALSYGLPKGAGIASVTEGTPAEDAGIQANDIVTAIDGQEITSAQELIDAIAAKEPGDTITLTIYRQGETIEIEVKLGEYNQTVQEQTTQQDEQQNEQQNEQQYNPFGDFGQDNEEQSSKSGSIWDYFK